MSFVRKITSVFSELSEETVSNNQYELANNGAIQHSGETEDVNEAVKHDFEKVFEEVILSLTNSIRHHAGFMTGNHIAYHPFTHKFINDYCASFFKKGYLFGFETESGVLDYKYHKAIERSISYENERLLTETEHLFHCRKTAECFSFASQRAFELGIEAGESFCRNT